MLWFAQNSLPLRWQRQFLITFYYFFCCCDLLKIHYLCGDKDNKFHLVVISICVVICSKFITFAVTKTIYILDLLLMLVLWFAQNSLPLRWQRQCFFILHCLSYRCDLLKIHYLCGDKDNILQFIVLLFFVVICSKFITFAVTKTIIYILYFC